MKNSLAVLISFLITLLPSTLCLADDSHNHKTASSETMRSQQLNNDIYMLIGDGGNIGLLLGENGSFMIDDKFAPLSEAIVAKVQSLGGDVPKYLVNTHFHADHAGGNENFGKAGSTIVAHHNVRARLSAPSEIKAFGMVTPAQPKAALPELTFSKDMHLHINGQTISITHIPNAHTDGDAIVQFIEANVIHTGDAYFNGFFPFIDVAHGGSLRGMIAATDTILALSNNQTKIIPGHGPLASASDLRGYRKMLTTAEKRLSALKKQGMNAKAIIAEQPLKDLEEQWGHGMFSADRWIELIYDGI